MGKKSKSVQPMNGETKGVQLQLTFDRKQYQAIEAAAAEDNKRMNLVSRKEKIHQYKAVGILVDQGLAHRAGEIYIPADKREEFLKDKRFNSLLEKAELAVSEFRKYQDTLLAVPA